MEAWWKVVRVSRHATVGTYTHPRARCPLLRTCGPDGRVHAISEKECPETHVTGPHGETTVSPLLFDLSAASRERRENTYVCTYVRFLRLSLSLSRAPVSGREKPLLLSFQMAPVLFRLGCSLGR